METEQRNPAPPHGKNSLSLTLLQRVSLRLLGYAKVGVIMKPGWKGSLPLYVIRCEKHDLVTDYPHGWEGRLSCPLCQKEAI